MTIHQPRTVTREQHPPAPQTCPLAPGTTKAASTRASNCMPLSTRPSSSQSSIHQHPKLHAPSTRPARKTKQHPPAPQTACPQHPAVKLAKQHPPAPETACPGAPGRQARRPARKPADPRPAVKLAKQHLPAPQTACPVAPAPHTACPLAPGRQARKAAPTSTPNCMPPSTRPASSQSSTHQHPKLHAP